MHLKGHLRKSLTDLAQESELQTARLKKARASVENVNTHNALYNVLLTSLWEDKGEKSINFDYRGSLESALHAAEEEFLKVNKRSDVQARYFVTVLVAAVQVPIPEEFYRDFKRAKKY